MKQKIILISIYYAFLSGILLLITTYEFLDDAYRFLYVAMFLAFLPPYLVFLVEKFIEFSKNKTEKQKIEKKKRKLISDLNSQCISIKSNYNVFITNINQFYTGYNALMDIEGIHTEFTVNRLRQTFTNLKIMNNLIIMNWDLIESTIKMEEHGETSLFYELSDLEISINRFFDTPTRFRLESMGRPIFSLHTIIRDLSKYDKEFNNIIISDSKRRLDSIIEMIKMHPDVYANGNKKIELLHLDSRIILKDGVKA